MPELRRFASARRTESDAEGLGRRQHEVSALARRQHGVVSRSQLEACRLSVGAISRWVAAGRLHRIHPGIYSVGHAAVPLPGRMIAALLYAGPGAALSHTTAAWLWSLIDAEPTRIHVTVP